MTSTKLLRIFLVTIGVMLIISAILLILLLTRPDDNVIHADLEPGKETTYSFEALGLVPGETVDYTLVLHTEVSDEFDITMDFRELEPSPLKEFALVKIETATEMLFEGSLKDLLDAEEPLLFTLDIDKKVPYDITVHYSLPLDAGNEVQNAEAVFELALTATNE